MNRKILITPSSFGKISKEPILMLERNGFEVVLNPYGRKLTESETIDLCKDCVGVVAGLEVYSPNVIDQLTGLRVISRVGVGMDNIDIPYANSKGISVINTPDGPTRAVSEMALALVMSSLRKIPLANQNLKNGLWKKETGFLLEDKVVGILGMGRIGKMTSHIFSSLGNEVIGSDLFPDLKWAEKSGFKFVSLDHLLKNADILILHVSKASEVDKAVLSYHELDLMKKGSVLINLSRGGVVDEHSLIKHLENDKFSVVATDVFDQEPYSGPLLSFDNVTVTPHLGSYAQEGKLKMEISAIDNVLRLI